MRDAVKVVRPALGHDVCGGAGREPEFRPESIAVDLELLNHFRAHEIAGLTVAKLVLAAVHRDQVAAAVAASDGESGGPKVECAVTLVAWRRGARNARRRVD